MRHLLPVLALAGLSLCLTAAAQAALYQCKPDSKVRCEGEQCQAEAPGSFEHAEQFSLQTEGNSLLACLWTDCYDGPAQVLRDQGQITAMGLLRGREPTPIAVVLSIDGERRFTALWQIGAKGTTLDSGTCTLNESASID